MSRGAHLRVALALAIATLAIAPPAAGGTVSSTLPISAQVTNQCTISASKLDFGTYDPVSLNKTTDLLGSSTVTVNCTLNAGATIDLDTGLNAKKFKGQPARNMVLGGKSLAYQLYLDAARTQVWGIGAGNDLTYTGTGKPSNLTVYGLVFQNQPNPAGVYLDTVTATINF